MAYASVEYNYTGGPQTFNTNFALGILADGDVRATVDGVVDGLGNPIEYDSIYNATTGVVTITDTLPINSKVLIARITPIDELFVDFEAGADVTKRNVNNMNKQMLMAVQEIDDAVRDLAKDVAGGIIAPVAGSYYLYANRAEAIAVSTPAPVVRIGYQTTNGEFLVFSRAIGGTALIQADGTTWNPEDVGTVQHFGAAGDGVTDDTSAVRKALQWMTAGEGRRIVDRTVNTYRITETIVWVGVTNVDFGAATFLGTTLNSMFRAEVTAAPVTRALTANYVKGSKQIQVAALPTAPKEGSLIKINTNGVDPGNRDNGSLAAQFRTGEWATVEAGSTTTTINLAQALRFVTSIDPVSIAGDEPRVDSYTTALNARVTIVPEVSFSWKGGTIEYEDGHDAEGWKGGAMHIAGYFRPIFDGLHIRRGYSSGIRLDGTWSATIINCTFRNLTNNTALGQYGYGVADAAYGTRVLNCMFMNCRHGYTTSAPGISANFTNLIQLLGNGRVVGATIDDCYATQFIDSPFDTHMCGTDITFGPGNIAVNCAGWAYGSRGQGCRYWCNFRNCGGGIYCLTDYQSGNPDDDLGTSGTLTGDQTTTFIMGLRGTCRGAIVRSSNCNLVVSGNVDCDTASSTVMFLTGNTRWEASGDIRVNNLLGTAPDVWSPEGNGVMELPWFGGDSADTYPANNFLMSSGSQLYIDASQAINTTGINCAAQTNVTIRGRLTLRLPAAQNVFSALGNIQCEDDGIIITSGATMNYGTRQLRMKQYGQPDLSYDALPDSIWYQDRVVVEFGDGSIVLSGDGPVFTFADKDTGVSDNEFTGRFRWTTSDLDGPGLKAEFGARGDGSIGNMEFYWNVGASGTLEAMRIDAAGNVGFNMNAANAFGVNGQGGFAAPDNNTMELVLRGSDGLTRSGKVALTTDISGGSVIQATNKSTGVTLNKIHGRVQTAADALAAGASATFRITNSYVGQHDVPVVAVQSPTLKYAVTVNAVANGTFDVRLTNITGGSLSEAVFVNFVLMRGGIT